jgi:AraC-like DNA-binding protein
LLFRDRKMVRDGDDNVSLVVSLGRALSIRHRKREACLARNDAIIFQADAPGSAGTRQQLSVLEVSIAQREWEARNTRPGDMLMNVINRNSQTLSLLLGYIRVLPKAGLPSTAKARDLVGCHLIDLVILAVKEPPLGESQIDCAVAARRAAMLDYITSHFCDPNLSGSRLAEKLGISQRYLQRLLETTGKTFTEHVNGLRLDHAFLLLSGGTNKRVSDIAFEVGYTDLTNFYKHFQVALRRHPKGGCCRPLPPISLRAATTAFAFHHDPALDFRALTHIELVRENRRNLASAVVRFSWWRRGGLITG